MSEREARFYAAEMLLGIEAIHKLNYVYRDLKLENVLLDAEGHIRITDLGLAIELSERDKENKNALFADRYPPPHHMRTRGCAGTPGYIAPELINMKSYGFMPDFFTFGATLARLISKTTPFSTKLMDKNSVKRENFPTPWLPKNVSSECRDLIRRLCAFEEAKRLGYGCWAEHWMLMALLLLSLAFSFLFRSNNMLLRAYSPPFLIFGCCSFFFYHTYHYK